MKKTPKIFISRIYKSSLIVFISVLIILSTPIITHSVPNKKTIIVSTFDYVPGVFKDENGHISGFFVDMLNEMARLENWNLEYVHGTWKEGLDSMKFGSSDLYMGVAYRPERDLYLDYSKEAIMAVWTTTYSKVGSDIHNLFDVEGKTIGIMSYDHNGKVFKSYVEKLKIECTIKSFNTMDEIFIAINNEDIDVGVINSYPGAVLSQRYEVVRTNIIIDPFLIYFTTPQDYDPSLLNTISSYMKKWKDNKNSIYYTSLNKWLHQNVRVTNVVPQYVKFSGIGVALLIIGVLIYVYMLKSMVKFKTKELIESEKFIKSVMDNLPMGVAVNSVDPDVAFSYMNDVFPLIYRTTREELDKHDNFWNAVFEDENYRKWISNKVVSDCDTGDATKMHWEHVEITKDGEIIGYVNARNIPFRENQSMISTVLDVTEKVKVQKDLDKHSKLLKETNKLAKVGGWTFSKDGVFDWHQNVYDIFELPYDHELSLQIVKDLFHKPKDHVHMDNFIYRVFEKGMDSELFCEVTTFGKEKKWVHIIGTPTYEGGEVVEILGAVHDITELHMEQLELERMSKLLMQSQKMEAIGRLAGGISHDFNNILSPIVGYTELIMDDIDEDSPFKRHIDAIYESALRAKELVNQILTFSRTNDSSKQKIMKLNTSINEALKLMKASIPSSITITDDIDSTCCLVNADPTQIHRIIMNLCMNAKHAIVEETGEIKIKLSEILLDECDLDDPTLIAGTYACITVKDNGKGISNDVIDKIFEPFFTTKRKGEGTGMGLSVVHGVVTKMNGFIKIYSELDKGTEFRIYLPTVDRIGETIPMVKPKIPYENGTEHILLVDDEAPIIEMETEILGRLGYKVTSFTDSLEALKVFKEKPEMFDLVISDIAMPNMTGEQLAKEISKINPKIPILLCTGFNESLTDRKIKKNGIRGLLTKPVVMRILSREIRKVLDEDTI